MRAIRPEQLRQTLGTVADKGALYVPTTPAEKYKAKAFIDMFVQRFAKALAVGVSLCITLIFKDFQSLRWLSLVSMGIIVVWIVAVRYAGKRFQALTETLVPAPHA